jgi:hypothetical protein
VRAFYILTHMLYIILTLLFLFLLNMSFIENKAKIISRENAKKIQN